MSAVGASPDLLDALAGGLGRQATGHGEVGAVMRHAVAATPRASIVGPAALDLLADTARGLGDLQQRFDELAAFVRKVSDALREADRTLAGAVGSAGSSGSPSAESARSSSDTASGGGDRASFGDLSGSAAWRGYEGGARRTISGTVDDPFGSGRSVTTVRSHGSMQDGFTDMTHGVALWSGQRAAGRGSGVSGRLGDSRTFFEGEFYGGARATGHGSVAYGNGQVQLAVGGSAMYGVSATASARAGNEYAAVEGSVSAFGGVRADGDVTVGFGKDGVDAELRARAFAGGEIEGTAAAELLGVRGEATGSVMYGVGGEVNGDVEISMDKIEFSLDLGLAFGLGLSGGVDVSVNPREVVSKSVNAVSKPAKRVARKVGGWLS